MSLEREYQTLIIPTNFIKLFGDMEEFEQWCYLGTIDELRATKERFEEYELYEYCKVIDKVINILLQTQGAFLSDILKESGKL